MQPVWGRRSRPLECRELTALVHGCRLRRRPDAPAPAMPHTTSPSSSASALNLIRLIPPRARAAWSADALSPQLPTSTAHNCSGWLMHAIALGYDAGGTGNQTPHCSGYPRPAHAIAVTTADDRPQGSIACSHPLWADLQAVQSILADGGYVGSRLPCRRNLGAEVKIAKRSELHTFHHAQHRWCERSFASMRKMPPFAGRTWNATSTPAYISFTSPSSRFLRRW